MDVLALMKQDHDIVRSRLRAIREAKGVKNRRSAVLVCEASLKVQLGLEKDYLYPEITDLYPSSDHVIKIGLAAGVTIKRHLSQLVKLSAQPQAKQTGFEDKLEKLQEAVEKHLTEQQDLLMPRMRAAMRTEDREDLGQLFQEVREELAASFGGVEVGVTPARQHA